MVAYEHDGRPCPVLQQDKMHTEALDCIVAAISATVDGRDVARGQRAARRAGVKALRRRDAEGAEAHRVLCASAVN